MAHSAQLLRVASHRSTNAEMFERLFEKLSDITTKTWSKRIEDLSTNAILHLQAEKFNPAEQHVLREEKEISKMAKSLPKLDNTMLSKSDLEKYAGAWTAHLKLIADYLKPGEGVWWRETEDYIEFFDGSDEPSFRSEGPQLHHFRSTSINKEQESLDACWRECLENKVKIPATKLRNESGRWERPLICCAVEAVEGSAADQDYSSELQTQRIEQEVEDLLESSDDEPAEEDSDRTSGDDGLSNMDIHIDPTTSSEQIQTETQGDISITMEVDPIVSDEHPQTENQTDTENPLNQMQSRKRIRSEQETPPQEPDPKKQKLCAALVTKTARALQQVLGTCEEVLKYDKLKQNVTKNPKSRYHTEHYEIHLAKIQILTLKAYKKVFNDIESWKDNFRLSQHREATEADLKESIQIAPQRKQ